MILLTDQEILLVAEMLTMPGENRDLALIILSNCSECRAIIGGKHSNENILQISSS